VVWGLDSLGQQLQSTGPKFYGAHELITLICDNVFIGEKRRLRCGRSTLNECYYLNWQLVFMQFYKSGIKSQSL